MHVIVLESIPPLKWAPSATSLLSLIFTASSRRKNRRSRTLCASPRSCKVAPSPFVPLETGSVVLPRVIRLIRPPDAHGVGVGDTDALRAQKSGEVVEIVAIGRKRILAGAALGRLHVEEQFYQRFVGCFWLV